jgi:hypothetical protein
MDARGRLIQAQLRHALPSLLIPEQIAAKPARRTRPLRSFRPSAHG